MSDQQSTPPRKVTAINVDTSGSLYRSKIHTPGSTIFTEDGRYIQNSAEDGEIEDNYDDAPIQPILRRAERSAANYGKVEKLTPAQCFARSVLQGTTQEERDQMDLIYRENCAALPLPVADGQVVKDLKWNEKKYRTAVDKINEAKTRQERDELIADLSRHGPLGLARDIRLQDQYRKTTKLMGPYIKASDMMASGKTVDPDELMDTLSDGILLCADDLHQIQMARRRGIAEKDHSVKNDLREFVDNPKNYALEDEYKYVFGSAYFDKEEDEIEKGHKHKKRRNTFAQTKITTDKLAKGLATVNSTVTVAPTRQLSRFSSNLRNIRVPQYQQRRSTGASGFGQGSYANRYNSYDSRDYAQDRYVTNDFPTQKSVDMQRYITNLKLPYYKERWPADMSNFPLVPNMGARLTHFSKNWGEITQDEFILNLVRGHKIGFFEKPTQYPCRKTPILTPKMREKITELENEKVIEKASQNGIISPIFFRTKQNGKLRMILDLKQVNKSVRYEHFKMQSLKDAQNLIERGDYFVKLDIQAAYDSAAIHAQDRKFLQFSVGEVTYQFRGWPNGLAEAPRLFTKMLKPVLALFGKLGMRTVMFIDDLLIMHQCIVNLQRAAAFAVQLLTWLGFVISEEKSVLLPCQQIEFLGMLIDSTTMTMTLTDRKVIVIKSMCLKFLQHNVIGARELASLVGMMQAAWPAVHFGPLHFRHLQRDLISVTIDGSWNQKVTISSKSKMDLLWWKNHMDKHNGRTFQHMQPTRTITTDASSVGWGASCHGNTAQGPWTSEQLKLHINARELLAADYGLRALIRRRSCVALQMDNTTAITYINKMGGTKSEEMTNLATELWDWCNHNQITLMLSHIPGLENVSADRESRVMKDFSDFQLHPQVFKLIYQLRGPLKLDLFSSRWNYQLPEYYTWGNQPGSLGRDALQQRWPKSQSYAFPPFCLINRVLAKVAALKVKIVLVTPVWPTATWYGRLIRLSCQAPLLLPEQPDLLLDARKEAHPLILERRLRLAAWTLSGEKIRVLGLSEDVETIITRRHRKNTLLSYNHAWHMGRVYPKNTPAENLRKNLIPHYHQTTPESGTSNIITLVNKSNNQGWGTSIKTPENGSHCESPRNQQR